MSLASFERERATAPLLVAFADLTHFAAECSRTDDPRVAEVMDTYYELVSSRVREAGGRVVKFMGDAALIVFAEEDADRGTVALLDLKGEVDSHFAALGWQCRLVVKVHFGTVVAGPYGARGEKRFDLLGRNVNVAATLPARDVALSAEAFRKLAPDTRKRFKKHTPPIVYIPLVSRRP